MDSGATPEPLCAIGPGRTVAIIGGGFSGAALAFHLSQAVSPGPRILVFEPRAQLGAGLAYSTQDAAHRLNARAGRMSLSPDEQAHFSNWIAATAACAGDTEAAMQDGRLFPQRAVFGAYVAAHLAPLVQSGRVTHVRAVVAEMEWRGGMWSLQDETGRVFKADIAVLATGYAPPAVPNGLARLAGHLGFISEPLAPQALQRVPKSGNVLVVGTGLTMADCVAVLHRNGHTGKILAISRRGQKPRPHAEVEHPPFHDFGDPPATARLLLRRVREALAKTGAAGQPWQSVFDGLRAHAEELWAALPAAERTRLWRHARPFWDSHRFRLPPATGDCLHRRLAEGRLVITAATLVDAAPAGEKMSVQYRSTRSGAVTTETFDAILVTAGFGRVSASGLGLVETLISRGLVTLDETGQGLRCDAHGRAHAPAARHPLYLLGPPTRGSFADVTGVPEIARQAARIAQRILAETDIRAQCQVRADLR